VNIIALIALIFAFLLFLFAAKWRPATPFPWHLGWLACALVVAVFIWYTHLWSVSPVH
jgi:hypothetical protein